LQEVQKTCGAVWIEPDVHRRRPLLETARADDDLCQNPGGEARGGNAPVAHIGAMQAQFPGARVEVTTSGAYGHHDRIRFAWRMVDARGRVQIEGMDFARIDSNGRLAEIIGFFGAAPPAAGQRPRGRGLFAGQGRL